MGPGADRTAVAVMTSDETLREEIATLRAALDASDRQRRAIFHSALDAMVIISPDGRYTDVNAAACALYGRTRDEILRARVGEFSGQPAEGDAWSALSERRRGDWFVVRPDGTRRDVEYTAAEFGLGSHFVVVRDVTESRKAERRLRQSEAHLRAVLDAALDAVIGMDAEDRITHWNPRAEVIFGWPREDALGRTLRELIIPERYRDAHRKGLAHFLATGEGPVLGRRIEVYGLRRDGTEFPLELSITALKEGDGWTFSAFVADITDRRRSEIELRRYADVFRNMQVGVNVWWLEDRSDVQSFKLISTNPAALHSLGLRTEDILGKRIGDLFPHMLGTELPALYRNVVLTGEARDLGEVGTSGGGEGESEAIFATKVFPLPGDCVGVAFENITERRRLEEQLRQSQRLEAIGSLAGGVAHDFNNLLSVILGQCELVGRTVAADDRMSRRVEEIRKAGERAALLTRQLLAFSRKQVLVAEILDLESVVADLASMLRRLIGEDIALRTVVHPTGAVRADRGQIEQVVTNLVVNARDAMPQGGTITLEVEDADIDAAYAAIHPPTTPGRYVRLRVTDTGMGMDAATRERAFEPFFTTKEKGKGTGLGLATVYGIVKQSGGFVWLSSERGRGASVEVFLPRVDDMVAPDPPRAPPDAQKGTETILLVEDEDMLRELACEVLQEAGYHLLSANGGDAAVRLAADYAGTIHLLLTDVVMPGMSGPQAAERIGARRPEMKVLFTTGYTDDAILQRGVQTEQMELIAKPYATAALARKVREVLDAPPLPLLKVDGVDTDR